MQSRWGQLPALAMRHARSDFGLCHVGDLDLAQAVNASLYAVRRGSFPLLHLIFSYYTEGCMASCMREHIIRYFYQVRSAIRPDMPYGLSPGGLASNAYEGHTFWDQETWMWPPLLMLDPGCAESALQYRFDRRPNAHVKATNCGKENHASSGGQGALEVSDDALMFPWAS